MPENRIGDPGETPDTGLEDMNETVVEAPAGTQATHSAAQPGARERVAERATRLSSTLDHRALELELKGGIKSKAAPAVRGVSRAVDSGAAYVRANDVDDMRRDLEEGIREHPLRSVAIALGCGYLLAKLLD